MGRSYHDSGCPRYRVGISILLIFSIIATIHADESCPDVDINFFLYTRKNWDESHQVFVNETHSNLDDTFFDKNNPTKIIVHGYGADMHLGPLVKIRKEYLTKMPSNIIAVDWQRPAAANYFKAVGSVSHVGYCLAQLIERLMDHHATKIHVIGFSLGAHVPAFAANVLPRNAIDRITGLDPAMPGFMLNSPTRKLDSRDAVFVDVIHTNSLMQGAFERMGDSDFYMNGGLTQPGCSEETDTFNCHHLRAAVYFAESINSNVGFWGWQCDSYSVYLLFLCPTPTLPAVRMGDDVDRSRPGFFLAKTEAVAPYAKWPFSTPRPNIEN